MNKNLKNAYNLGSKFLFIGFLSILIQLIMNYVFLLKYSVYDAPPSNFPLSSDERLYYFLIFGIGIVSTVLFLLSIRTYLQKGNTRLRRFAYWMFLFCTLAINASLLFGGGWYVGTIFANIGCTILLYTIYSENKTNNNNRTALSGEERDNLPLNKSKKVGIMFSAILIAIVTLSATVPYVISINDYPQPLISSLDSLPSDITPNRTNTFYILPIWEGSANGEYEIQQMKELLGGEAYTGEGFVRIGRSVSCWYTNSIFENGTFNPASLNQKLALANKTETPILFHMNGGNWGQCCSQNEVISQMREDVNNCQWDQNNVCHPVKFNPGPNDRFWSLAPDTDWENFRETNIKVALSYIYDWWQENPDLLVGFSTDSEIHLNYHSFEDTNEGGYRSVFDYNPKTIAQYREWAQSNWTLSEFNTLCETSFSTWAEVDAPRDESVVLKNGNSWWEMWTDFRIWHVWEAGRRQCEWIHSMGFSRDMIWHHQILSEPDDFNARYIRADPLETAINPYTQVGITRYGWIEPEVWHSLGVLDMQERDVDIPSWGIFEWNIWRDHRVKLYEETLNMLYQYGCAVICPNEWINCSGNEGLWIPGDECVKEEMYEVDGVKYGSNEMGCGGSNDTTESCCIRYDDQGNCTQWVYKHGNPQFQKAMQDFVAKAQDYPRGTSPELRLDKNFVFMQNQFSNTNNFFSRDGLYLMGGVYLLCVVYAIVISSLSSKKRKNNK